MWPFSDPANVATFTSQHVLLGEDISHAYRAWEDGSWSFLPAHETQADDCKLVSLQEVFRLDPSIGELADLPCGWKASRKDKKQPWLKEKDHPFPEFNGQGYYLIEVASYPSVSPPAPAQAKRENLLVGTLVKLLFRFAAEDASFKDYDIERMWVQVDALDEDYGRYQGSLANYPQHENVLAWGSTLWFSPQHIFAIDEAAPTGSCTNQPA